MPKDMTKVSYYRRNAGLTQKQLAEAAGIPLTTIRQYEHRTRNPNGMSLDAAVKIAKALDCRPEDLLEPEEGTPS